jgi:RHS repeat-associated protein
MSDSRHGLNRHPVATDWIAGTIARIYDDLDRLTDEQSAQGEVSYSYDNAGRRTSMTVAGQPAVSYAWDNANRLTGITQGSASVSFAYDNANRRSQLTLPNGIVVAYSYDQASRVSGMTWKLGGNQIGDLAYGYDADGRVIEKSGSMAATNLPQPVVGNTFNADNEMTVFNGTALAYDANGNLTTDGTNTYAWDARNHLSAISGAVAANFLYDPFGRRMSKAIGGIATQFLYDGLNPVQELQSGTPSANLLTGLGIDEYFQRTDSAGARDLLTDMLGSTLALADATGAIQTSYTYEPFGNAAVSGASSNNPFQFTGRENDGTGLYFYRARYYSPTFQRFVSQDPLGFAGGHVDLYGYASNDPVDYRDASGKLLIGGLLTAAACGAYDVYQHYSLVSDENALANQVSALRQQIQDLSNQENSCPNVNPEREQQIEELEQKAFNLAGQLATAHASDFVHGLATTTVCLGLTAVASSPLVPF